MRVQPCKFFRSFPQGLIVMTMLTTKSLVLATLVHWGFWVAVALLAGLGYLWIVRVREHFLHGCVNPGCVVSTRPYLVAVHTDLTTGAGEFPAIKILEQPLAHMTGGRPALGDRVATIALYGLGMSDRHWADFQPVAVNCVTANVADIERTLASIGPDEWQALDEGLQRLPHRKPGLYPLWDGDQS